MPVPTADELALLRADWEAGLTDTATIRRKSETRTAGGGVTPNWEALYTGSAKLLPGSAGLGGSARIERDQAGKLVSVQLWTVNLPHGTDVDRADRLVFGDRTFEILSVASWLSNEVGRTCLCAEVR